MLSCMRINVIKAVNDYFFCLENWPRNMFIYFMYRDFSFPAGHKARGKICVPRHSGISNPVYMLNLGYNWGWKIYQNNRSQNIWWPETFYKTLRKNSQISSCYYSIKKWQSVTHILYMKACLFHCYLKQ